MRIPLGQYISLLNKYLTTQKSKVVLLALLVFGNTVLQLIPPQIMRIFIDSIGGGAALNVLIRLALLFIGLAVVQQIISIFTLYLTEDVAWTATNDLRIDLANHCLQLDMTFHNEHTPGEMIERLDGDVTVLSNFFSQFVIQIISNTLLMVGVTVLLFGINWIVGLVTLGFVALSLAVMLRLRNVAVPFAAKTRQRYADFYSYLEERLAGTEEIQANGARAYIMQRFYALLRHVFQAEIREQWVHGFVFSTLTILATLGNILALGVSATLFQTSALTIGTVYLILHYTNMLTVPLNAMTRQVEDLQKAGASIARLEELMGFKSKIQDTLIEDHGYASTGSHLAPALSTEPTSGTSVSFEAVSFSYNDQMPVLHDISFQLKPGQVLGLLGRTGSGKTTLTRLLFRLYDPKSGCIRLGDSGDDIRQIPLLRLRRDVGMVTQNVQLFHASLRDNLTFWDPTISDALIIQTLHELALDAWVRSQPDGLDTVLSSDGLSAGEAQLLALTRIFLRDPSLIILDEASSRLDPATEQQLEQAIDKLLQNRTAIIIAHRLSTVQRADEIMILDQGRIREYGPRLALASDPSSMFSSLMKTGTGAVLV